LHKAGGVVLAEESVKLSKLSFAAAVYEQVGHPGLHHQVNAFKSLNRTGKNCSRILRIPTPEMMK
jgi:hypothetical protein